jgi:putative PIN family toxin of toxin-antitoxin system
MQRLVIDTNVFVSYLISENGYCFKIIDHVLLTGKTYHYLSDDTLKEYTDVFNRIRFAKKYPSFQQKSILLLSNLIELSGKVTPTIKVNEIKDETDNKFLELAYTVNADFLITGNKLHFTFSEFYNTQIVSPKEYWENYRP